MDVQQADDGAGAGAPPTGGSRTGLIVGLLVAALVAVVAFAVLLTREGADDPVAAPTPSATATTELTPTPEPTPTPTTAPSPTVAPSPTTAPAEVPQLRPDGIGPLTLLMTADEAVATGAVTLQETAARPERVPDPVTYPGLFVGWDRQQDAITSFLVKDGSPITTPDGIGVTSTPDDVKAAYGPLVQERTADGETWWVVPVDEVGYAFFPDGEGGLILVAATDIVLADLEPGQGLF
jgi:hypothetical protein